MGADDPAGHRLSPRVLKVTVEQHQSEGQGNGCSTPAAPPICVSSKNESSTSGVEEGRENKERGASLMADGLRRGAYKFEYF